MRQQKKAKAKKTKQLLGWREWVTLPELGVKVMKAKMDTGARTSALHADDMEFYHRKDKTFVRFVIHPIQRSTKKAVHAHAEVVEWRMVRSSGGHVTERPVISTPLVIGDQVFDVELTLINRDVMGFRMLIGRQAVRGKFLVDPGQSYLTRRK